jgi:hypothetical protein
MAATKKRQAITNVGEGMETNYSTLLENAD